jgi:hypothetical protein
MKILKAIAAGGLGLVLTSLPCNARVAQTAEQDEAAAKASIAALSDAERGELKAFSDRAKQYMKMEGQLPADKLKPTTDVADLEKQRVALRDALQQARPNAKQGEIFTPEVGDVFRKLLRSTMAGPSGRKVRASLNHAEPIGPRDLKVNQVYPNVSGQPLQSVPPTLLLNLPILPKGLEYRIVDHTLVLRDANANTVVDFLPDALP